MDVPIDENENLKAKEIRDKLFKYQIDKIYSSTLFRNLDTIARMFEFGNKRYPVFIHLDKGKMRDWGHFIDISDEDVPVYVSEKLNERYYGKLQGENKETAVKKYGEEKVHLWRRSYNIAPRGAESLKEVIKRTTPFYKKYIEKDLKQGKNVLVVASHNSLRALIKYVEKISEEDIINVEVPFAGLVRYELDKSLKLKNKIII
jgi:2,3-bisphosphoglycerate-dependent phosphoglycerate mutase